MKNINTKITAIRHLRRYTQEDAAERSHIAIRTYQRIESGACSPRLGHLESLAAAFECSIEDVLYFNLEQNAFPEKMDMTLALEQECAQLHAEVGYLRQLVRMVRRAAGGGGHGGALIFFASFFASGS